MFQIPRVTLPRGVASVHMADASPSVLSARNPSGHSPTSRNTCKIGCCRRPALLVSYSCAVASGTLSVMVRSNPCSALSVSCCMSAMALEGRQPLAVSKQAAKSSVCRARRDNVWSASLCMSLLDLLALELALVHLQHHPAAFMMLDSNGEKGVQLVQRPHVSGLTLSDGCVQLTFAKALF